jgi:hypothetical protein
VNLNYSSKTFFSNIIKFSLRMKKFTLAFSLLLAGVSGAFAATPTVGTADAPAYYTIGSYNRGGYLTELDAPITGWNVTSSLAHTELTESSLWEVYTTGNEDGSVYIKNHATGNYLFTTGPVNVTSEATPVWILENGVNDFGFAISSTSTNTNACIDADNYDTLCGTWGGYSQPMIQLATSTRSLHRSLPNLPLTISTCIAPQCPTLAK